MDKSSFVWRRICDLCPPTSDNKVFLKGSLDGWILVSKVSLHGTCLRKETFWKFSKWKTFLWQMKCFY